MAWEWLTDVVDWGADLVGDVGDWGSDLLSGGDAWGDVVDVAKGAGELLDLYEPTKRQEVTGYNPVTGAPIMKDIDQGWNLGGLFGLGQDIYGSYRQSEGADQLANLYAPLVGIGQQASSAMQPYLDPTQRAQMQAAEEQRLTGLMTPFVERAAYRGRASDLSQGVGDSSIADWRDKMRQQQAAELVQQHVVPTAASKIQAQAANLGSLFGTQADLLKPTVSAGVTKDGTAFPSLGMQYSTAQQQANPFTNLINLI